MWARTWPWLVPGALVLAGAAWAVISLAPGSRAPAAESTDPQVRRWRQQGWQTDFSRRSVEVEEIISGGPPRDGIPPIDDPAFVTVDAASAWLGASEPVMVYRHGSVAKAYPLQILIWHEIVNDRVGGRPVAVTYCPLCNSALVFDRRVEGRVLDFGTTGKLRRSDLVMYDRQTESWWQQLTGTAIAGEYTGTELTFLPSPLVSFRTFGEQFPGGRVLSRDTGHSRPYGSNPYVAYDAPGNDPFLLRGEPDGRLPPMERVLTLQRDGRFRAYPYSALAGAGVVEDTFAGKPVLIFYRKGKRSALDARRMADSRDVGAAAAYRPTVEGRRLHFRQEEGGVVDEETGSRWNLLGHATAGPLEGQRLQPVEHGTHFAFAWFAFRPDTELWRGE